MTNKKAFKWLLFDFDNTLVDFSKASKKSFWLTFEANNKICSEEIYETYHEINHQVWSDFEKGKITAELLRVKRFSELFRVLGEEEMDATLFSQQYLENLVVASEVFEGVIELLTELKADYKMTIVTNGLKEVQRPRLAKLKLSHFFDSILVSDEIGVAKPNIDFFEQVHVSIPSPPDKKEILMIGDSLNSDILGGINFGVKTCWIAHGKENKTTIKPDYVVKDVFGLREILM